MRIQERKAKIEPVAETYATSNQGTLRNQSSRYSLRKHLYLNHDQLPSPMRSRAFRLPSGNRRCVQTVTESDLACQLTLRSRCDGSALPSNQSSRDKLAQGVRRALQGGADNHDRRAKKDDFPSPEGIPDEDTGDGAEETANIVSCH